MEPPATSKVLIRVPNQLGLSFSNAKMKDARGKEGPRQFPFEADGGRTYGMNGCEAHLL